MTANERLTLGEVELLACILQNSNSDFAKSVKQCADLMRENELLKTMLKRMRKDMLIAGFIDKTYTDMLANPAKDE